MLQEIYVGTIWILHVSSTAVLKPIDGHDLIETVELLPCTCLCCLVIHVLCSTASSQLPCSTRVCKNDQGLQRRVWTAGRLSGGMDGGDWRQFQLAPVCVKGLGAFDVTAAVADDVCRIYILFVLTQR